MNTYRMEYKNGHVFVALDGNLWLIDTGSPGSFGRVSSLSFAGEQFNTGTDLLGLNTESLSNFTEVECFGLIGADILNQFDHIWDISEGELTVSSDQLSLDGQTIPLDMLVGIPIINVRVNDSEYQMFFDTGAQLSYFQDESLKRFPMRGIITDFHHTIGQFQTEIHLVPVSLGSVEFTLRCGKLPESLEMTLMLASTKGIISNEVLKNRTVGYFPRRRLIVL